MLLSLLLLCKFAELVFSLEFLNFHLFYFRYVGEIAHKDVRGTLSTFFQLFVTIGILFSYTLGSFVDVYWLTLISALIPIIFAVVFVFMPESPTHLVIKGERLVYLDY